MKFVIWSNEDLNMDDWREEIEVNFPDTSSDEALELAYEMNADHLGDEILNLAIPLSGEVLAIADLGLWFGRRAASKEISPKTIGDILAMQHDSDAVCETWMLNGVGDLCYEYHHHDGTNRIIYREIKPDVSRARIENLRRKIALGTAKRSDITRLTSSLGPRVKSVYGWR